MPGQSSEKPVVVYGASGYTGRLICEYLREYNLPFVAAGRSEDKLRELAARHGLERWTTDLDQALGDDDFPLYFDAQITSAREGAIMAALAAGRHVYTEKPIAESLEGAVALAWLAAAEDLPGIRAVLDHHAAHPTTPEMDRAMAVATAKEHEMLALMAGRASAPGPAAQRVGRAIEAGARTSYVPGARSASRSTDAPTSLVGRLKAVLAA